MRYPLVGGSYVARAKIANAQRCVNYYPESNRADAPVPFTYYQRPGLRQQAQGTVGPVRLLYQASNGQGFAVIASTVYYINPNWTLTVLGTLVSPGTTPCAAIDNGTDIMLVDGSTTGYKINLATHAFAPIVDPTGLFQGGNSVATLDTYVLWNMPGTTMFGSTLSGSITFDALYFAGKVGYPDPIVGIAVNRHELILLGALKSEIWYDAGNPLFPFAILPGAYIEHGCAAKYSIASADIEVFWLGKDLQGHGVVFALRSYDTRRISNYALEYAIQQMGDISDAIGYTYQQGGHYFYVLTFPSANQTWVYDAALGKEPDLAWHQRAWTDGDGNLNRDRGMSCASIYGLNVVGDWENGKIYALDPTLYLDEVGTVPSPLTCVKGFPHLFEMRGSGGPFMLPTDNKRIQFHRFIADIECGQGLVAVDGTAAKIGLRTSRDRGYSFSETVLQSTGELGAYGTAPTWQPMGVARDMVFEIEHAIAGPAALNGCWVEAEILDT